MQEYFERKLKVKMEVIIISFMQWKTKSSIKNTSLFYAKDNRKKGIYRSIIAHRRINTLSSILKE